MLVEGALGSIRSLAGLHGAPIVPVNLVSRPPIPLFAIFVSPLTILNLLPFFLQLQKPRGEFVPLVDQLPHLREEHHIGEI